MLKIRKIISLILMICLIILLSGCGKTANSLIGKWNYYKDEKERTDIAYIFNKDMTGEYIFFGESKKFKYENDDKEINIKFSSNEIKLKYTIKNNILTIIDSIGEKTMYKKKNG